MLWTYVLIWLVTIAVVFIVNFDKGLGTEKKYWALAGTAALLLSILLIKNSGTKEIKFNEVLFQNKEVLGNFNVGNLGLLKKHENPYVFIEKNGRVFNLTSAILGVGIVNVIEAPEQMLFSETLALELDRSRNPYLYLDLDKAPKLAQKFRTAHEFWANFLQALINDIQEDKFSFYRSDFELIFDNYR